VVAAAPAPSWGAPDSRPVAMPGPKIPSPSSDVAEDLFSQERRFAEQAKRHEHKARECGQLEFDQRHEKLYRQHKERDDYHEPGHEQHKNLDEIVEE
jgi:hypothetical protein